VTDIANRLTEDDDFTYAYDANGNLTSKTAKAGGAVTSYSYDAQNQLTRIDFPDLTFATYRYDGLGRRIEKDVNGTLTQYVYDGSDALLEFDGASALLARYSHGQSVDQPLAVERDLDLSGTFEAGEQFYYQADQQGSARADNAKNIFRTCEREVGGPESG
jgi:YD repeat-containing protein